MNVVIPMAGLGQRFHQEGFLQYKPLVKILGDPILERLLACLNLDGEDVVCIPHMISSRLLMDILKVYFLDIEVFNDLHQLKEKWKGTGKGKCILVELALPTRGAADTLRIATTFLSQKRPLLSLDCDNIYEQSPCDKVKRLSNDGNYPSAILYFNDTQRNPIYSYIREVDNKVVAIKEKEKISDLACSGGYFFASTALAKMYADKVISTWGDTELYISSMFKEMILAGETIVPVLAKPTSLGVPMAVEAYASSYIPQTPKTFCFDLDSTLVTTPYHQKDYQTCRVIPAMASFVRYVFNEGHTVIIHTARGMKTFNDRETAELTHRENIMRMLREFNIPYHSLVFGKPYADFYIDDKAINTCSNICRETGFYNHHNPPNMTHTLESTSTKYIKKGNLEGEFWWYTHIPSEIEDLFPPLLDGSTPNTVITEKIRGITFSQKYLAGTLTITHLQALLYSLSRIHQCSVDEKDSGHLYDCYRPKLEMRMSNEKDTPVYTTLMESLEEYQRGNHGVLSVIHGDPVFTNVFLTETHMIQLIDMRGKQRDHLTIYGDKMYDLAKVYQSLTGYDMILHGAERPYNMAELLAYFEKAMGGKMKWIYLLTASLYYTLIPLHLNETPEQLQQYRNMVVRLLAKFNQTA